MTVQNNQFFPRLAAANPEKSNSQDVFLFSCINRLIPTCHFVMQSGPAWTVLCLPLTWPHFVSRNLVLQPPMPDYSVKKENIFALVKEVIRRVYWWCSTGGRGDKDSADFCVRIIQQEVTSHASGWKFYIKAELCFRWRRKMAARLVLKIT